MILKAILHASKRNGLGRYLELVNSLATWTKSARDAFVIVAISTAVWFVIERTETCDKFFDWVAENPDYEVDSFILAFVLGAFGVMAFAIRRYGDMRSEMIKRREAQEQVYGLAYHDPLTGLRNRRALAEHLEQLMAQGSGDTQLALLIVDLDRFKSVNDVHGHLAGDQLLLQVGKRLSEMMPEGGGAFRLGGDEFAIVLDLTGTSGDAARALAKRIVRAMSQPVEEGTRTHHIGASVGISVFPDDADNREDLMRRADVALYRAKDGGRGGHRSFELKMDAEIARRANIEAELREALRRDEFRPAYQPLVDLTTGTTVGFELLARWPRADGMEVGPGDFIPIAEESGLITEMMLKLLACACEDARGWDPALTIAINISPLQLSDPYLCPKILATLTRFGFAPSRLAVEITENALIVDCENAKRAMEAFKNLGMKIGLDDFGTGYSSLHHLRVLPFDKIKIDRSFVQAIGHDPEALKIIRAIIGLAASLDLPIIAEGIESAAVALQLKELGCTQGQGFHLGYPVSGDQVSQVLARSGPMQWSRMNTRAKPVAGAIAA